MSHCGIRHSSCIDRVLIEEIIGCPMKVRKHINQRLECGRLTEADKVTEQKIKSLRDRRLRLLDV